MGVAHIRAAGGISRTTGVGRRCGTWTTIAALVTHRLTAGNYGHFASTRRGGVLLVPRRGRGADDRRLRGAAGNDDRRPTLARGCWV